MFHVPCCFNSLISICIALRNSNLCGPPMPRRVWKYQGLLQLPCKVFGITQVCDASNCPSVQIMGPSVRVRCRVGLEPLHCSPGSDHPGVHFSNHCVLFMLLIKVELHWSPLFWLGLSYFWVNEVLQYLAPSGLAPPKLAPSELAHSDLRLVLR